MAAIKTPPVATPADMSEQESFRTLRGFIAGYEPDEETYFSYSATLRIFGDIPDLEQISESLGLQPTHSHHKGDRPGPKSPPYKHDMWSYSPDVREEEPLETHINALWNAIRDKRDYLRSLKDTLTVNVFLGYQSNNDMAGFEIPHTSLEMFTELEIPFDVSVIIA
jgi:hypothetical protein